MLGEKAESGIVSRKSSALPLSHHATPPDVTEKCMPAKEHGRQRSDFQQISCHNIANFSQLCAATPALQAIIYTARCFFRCFKIIETYSSMCC